MKTAANGAIELREYLKALGYEVYVGTRPEEYEVSWDTGGFSPYLIITHTQTSLRRADMHAAGDRDSPRHMYITIHAIGALGYDGADEAAELLEEVNDLIEFRWRASDSLVIRPSTSYGFDSVNTNSTERRVVHSQRYVLGKNVRI